MKHLLITVLILGSQLLAAEARRFDLAKRASEIDPRAQEHPAIKFTFTDDKGKPADLQHAVVDTRVPSQGKLVIWLMGHNQGLFERISSYGYHGIQPHYSNGWFAGITKTHYEDGSGRAHTVVVPGGKDAMGQWVYDEVFRYLFTHPVDQSGPAVPMDADCKMDQRQK